MFFFATSCAGFAEDSAKSKVYEKLQEYAELSDIDDVVRVEHELKTLVREFYEEQPSKTESDVLVDKIKALLDSPSSENFAIQLLGEIGPPAKGALPTIYRTIELEWEKQKRRSDIVLGPTFVDETCRVLPKITLKPASLNKTCAEYFDYYKI